MFESFETRGVLRRPVIPEDCQHNAHMYYVLLPADINRQKVLDAFKQHSIGAVFHYVPLHSSPAGMQYGRVHGSLEVTKCSSERIIRLPLWVGISEEQQTRVVDLLRQALI